MNPHGCRRNAIDDYVPGVCNRVPEATKLTYHFDWGTVKVKGRRGPLVFYSALTLERLKEKIMTELKLTLPDSLARDARKAGLLTPKAIGELLRDAMRRRAARAFLSNAPRVARAKIPPMSADEIQAEIDAVRQARRPARARRR